MVLINTSNRLLRNGLGRAYRFEEQEVEGVRGKLNLAETLKRGKRLKGRTICQVDELTQDVVINHARIRMADWSFWISRRMSSG